MNRRVAGRTRGNPRMTGVMLKMSFLLCTIFLKSVLISRSPQLFVLRIGAVSFSTDFGRREV
jgi:K+-transporting ATPase A subunit